MSLIRTDIFRYFHLFKWLKAAICYPYCWGIPYESKRKAKEKSVCAICRHILVPFPLSLGSGCYIQERDRSLKKKTSRGEQWLWTKYCKTLSAYNDLTSRGLAIKKKGMTGNVRTIFKYTERYWKKEVYNLLCMLLMNKTKNNRTYILGEFTLGEKNFKCCREGLTETVRLMTFWCCQCLSKDSFDKHLVAVTWAQLILS